MENSNVDIFIVTKTGNNEKTYLIESPKTISLFDFC